MTEGQYYYETKRYRCLDYLFQQNNTLYLTMCGLERCVPGKSFGPGHRSGYHLHVILAGEGVVEVNDRHLNLHAGQLFLEKPGEVIYYYASKENPWTYCWVTFDGECAGYYMEQAGFEEHINVVNSYVDTNEFYNLANQLLSKPERNLANNLRRQGLLNQFVGLAVESYSLSTTGRQNMGNSPDAYVDHALDYIHNNFPSIKVSDISQRIGINRSYFTNIFTQRVGISPREYLRRLRLRESVRLLTTSELSIQDIAMKVGYDNPLTFSKMFKSAYGVSPKHFRELPEAERARVDECDTI